MQLNDLLEIAKYLAAIGAGSTLTLILAAIYVLFFPEKLDALLRLVWRLIEAAGLFYKTANKEKIKHTIQGDVSNFAKTLSNELPECNAPAVKLEWLESAESRKAFIENGKAIIRLRRKDDKNENIVSASLLYVSQILLRRSVRYLSPTQRQAIELYVGYKLFERQPKEVLDVFVDQWLYPGIEDGNDKISAYFERFRQIDGAQFFLPVFFQELIYMGDKVFNRKRDDSVQQEVDSALQFLETHAARKRGEKSGVDFAGDVCRFAIMIVGLNVNVGDGRYDVYLNHITGRLVPCGVETIYMIGPEKNAEFMREVARQVSNLYNAPFSRNYAVILYDEDGKEMPSKNFLLVLRSKTQVRYIGADELPTVK